MSRILLKEGHTIEALLVLESLKFKGYFLIVLYDLKTSYDYRSKYLDIKLVKPDLPYDSMDFLNYFLDLVIPNSIDIIIQQYDPSPEYITKNKDKLQKYTRFVIPQHTIIPKESEKII